MCVWGGHWWSHFSPTRAGLDLPQAPPASEFSELPFFQVQKALQNLSTLLGDL